MSAFGEEPLVTPVVVSHTSDQCRPTRLDIRADEKLIRIEFEKGAGTGEDFNSRFKDNATFQNLPDDEDGDPQTQEWDDFIGGTEIALWCQAQAPGTTNGEVLRKLANFLLKQKGVI